MARTLQLGSKKKKQKKSFLHKIKNQFKQMKINEGNQRRTKKEMKEKKKKKKKKRELV